MGNTKDRYLFEGEGGDQLCGRAVCGLRLTDTSFGTLPPHFDRATLDTITDANWASMLPGYSSYPEMFRQCLPFLLASIVFHEDFLTRKLPRHHRLFANPVFTGNYVTALRGKAITGIGTCPVTGMTACGVPPFMVTAAQVWFVRLYSNFHSNLTAAVYAGGSTCCRSQHPQG